MTFHSKLSTFLSSVATSLQRLSMGFSYHNSYVLPEHAKNYADCLYRARLLTIRLLEQSYIATRLKSSPQTFYDRIHELMDCYGVSICTMETGQLDIEKQRTLTLQVHLVHAPVFSEDRAARLLLLLLLFMYYFIYLMIFVALSVFHAWSLSRDILLIPVRILVPLITL